MKRDFTSVFDFSKDEIFEIFETAKELKAKTKRREAHYLLSGKTLATIFEKPSLRTRVTFETGMFQLGGHALYLAPQDIQLGKRESVPDVAKNLSRWVDGIMARTFAHKTVTDLAKYATVPVINGLSDLEHPCQIMADIFTVLEHKKTVENLKIVFVGDGNNVANSWVALSGRLKFHFVLSCPEGYEADKTIWEHSKKTGLSQLEIVHNPKEAVKDADVIYTDVWASMGQESESEKRKKVFANYQVNDELVKHAKKDYVFMHCLPAHRGEEVTDSVLDSSSSIILDEAENRLHVQKAIMVKLMK